MEWPRPRDMDFQSLTKYELIGAQPRVDHSPRQCQWPIRPRVVQPWPRHARAPMRSLCAVATAALSACVGPTDPRVDAESNLDQLCGLYSLDSASGPARDANIRNYPFVAGYVLRPSWSELEPEQGVYDFSMIDKVVATLQPIGKTLSLEMMRPPEPPYIARTPGVAIWRDTWRDLNVDRPVPWDPFLLGRFAALARAMADHPVPDASRGGAPTPFRDHPVLANVNLGIPGTHAAIRNPVEFRLIDMPGYSRAQLINAIRVDLQAVTDNFPAKSAYVGFWPIEDGTRPPTSWEEIRDMIHREFDGVSNPRVAFFQENLAITKDLSTGTVRGLPSTTQAAPLFSSKNVTSTAFQMLQAWNNPFQDAAKTANTVPTDAVAYAWTTFNTSYFEVYAVDLDDRRYWDSFTDWSNKLCRQSQS